MRSVHFAAQADGAVLVKDSISFKKEAQQKHINKEEAAQPHANTVPDTTLKAAPSL